MNLILFVFMFSLRKRHFYIIALILYSFLNIMVLNGDRLYAVQLPPEYLFIVVGYLCFGIWYVNLSIERYLLPRIKKVHPIVSQFVLSIFGITLLSVLSVLLTSSLLGQPFDFIQKNVVLTAGFNFRVNLFLNAINAVFFYNRKYREKELEAEKLKLSTLSFRYEALNNQINPHFLFNSLNTLSTLISLDHDKAKKFLEKLSNIYRYTLKSSKEELISLDEEITFLKDFINLLKIRFGDALNIQLTVKNVGNNQYIPPTALQMLMENVVKHNYFTDKNPLIVDILVENDFVHVKNTLQKKEVADESLGIGLDNIKKRYEYFKKSVVIEEKPDSYLVSIPIINPENEPVNS